MSNVFGKIFLYLLTLSLVLAIRLPAEAFDLGRVSLKGLDGVHVGVMKLDFEAEGVTREAIRNDVEAQLTKAGIRVLSAKECLLTPGGPTLNVGLKALKNSDGENSGYTYAVDLQLVQGVFLARDSKITLHADTWKTSDWGSVTEAKTLRKKIESNVDKFIRSYRAANEADESMKTKAPLELPSPEENPSVKEGNDSSGKKPTESEKVDK